MQRVVVTPVSFVLVTVAVWTVCSVSWIAPRSGVGHVALCG